MALKKSTKALIRIAKGNKQSPLRTIQANALRRLRNKHPGGTKAFTTKRASGYC